MSETPRTDGMEFTQEEANIFRQWFDAVQDLSPNYLTPSDYRLAYKLYENLGMRVPNSIRAAAGSEG